MPCWKMRHPTPLPLLPRLMDGARQAECGSSPGQTVSFFTHPAVGWLCGSGLTYQFWAVCLEEVARVD